MGVLAGEVHDRSGLVVLSLLAAEIFLRNLQSGTDRTGAASDRYLYRGGYRQHRRRMDFLGAAEARALLKFARKIAMFLCALCVVPMVLASWVHSLWGTVALISLAAAAHQGWSANLYTLVSDTFPRRAVGSVVGIGGMAGAVGNMVAAAGIGYLLQLTGNNYNPLLTICSFAYLVRSGSFTGSHLNSSQRKLTSNFKHRRCREGLVFRRFSDLSAQVCSIHESRRTELALRNIRKGAVVHTSPGILP